jgi:hypothetical protein
MESVEDFLKKNGEYNEDNEGKRKSINLVDVKEEAAKGKRKRIKNPYAKVSVKTTPVKCNSVEDWSDDFLADVMAAEEKGLKERNTDEKKVAALEQTSPALLETLHKSKEHDSPSGVVEFHDSSSICLLPKSNDKIIGNSIKERHVLISWVPLQGGIGLFRLRDTQYTEKYYSWTSKFNEQSMVMHNLWHECRIAGVAFLRTSKDNDNFALCPGNFKQTVLVYNPGYKEAYNKKLVVERMRTLAKFLNSHNSFSCSKTGDFYQIDVEEMNLIKTPIVANECPLLGHFTTDISTSFIFNKLFDEPVRGWRSQIGTLKKYFAFPFSKFIEDRYRIIKIENSDNFFYHC